MKRVASAAIFAGILLTGCSNADRTGAREKTHEAGRELNRDMRQAETKIKEGWHETKKELREGADKLQGEANRMRDKARDKTEERHR